MKNILFRPHRGSLTAAMAEIKEFKSEQEFKEYIVAKEKEYGYAIKPEDITIKRYGDGDDRIGWPNSYIVDGPSGVFGFLTYNVSLEDSLKAYEAFLNEVKQYE